MRLLVGLGNAERERRLLPGLLESGQLVVAERCLAADQLLDALRERRGDAAIIALDLHRLNIALLAAMHATGVPLIGLAAGGGAVATADVWAALLPADADAAQLAAAIQAAVRGERLEPALEPAEAELPVAPESPVDDIAPGVIAVVSGKGSPGCTTVAVNLAAALGAVAPTLLVDLDLTGPSVCAVLGLDPTRNLFMLAHAEPRSAREWTRALEQESQPLGRGSSQGLVLTGIPKPTMRAAISLPFLQRLLPELRQRYRYVVLDIGSLGAGADDAGHAWLAAAAGQLLFVTAPNVLGVWHAKSALAHVPELEHQAVALVINQHDRRTHHTRADIEWALGRQAAAVVPYDHRAIEKALSAQQPVIFDRHSRAGKVLLDLAERLNGGYILLPNEGASKTPGWVKAWPKVQLPRRTVRPMREPVPVPDGTTREEVEDGDRAPALQ